jgi:putative tryptophan/tyrosine transport system substrate-binding protein
MKSVHCRAEPCNSSLPTRFLCRHPTKKLSHLGKAMRRRDFIRSIGGTAAAWPLTARAQQPERIRRVGVLIGTAESDLEAQSLLSRTRHRLEELGWSDGRNIRIEDRWTAGDNNRLRAYAAELAELKPDVIVCEGTPVVAALQQATHTIPIVFVNANNPIGSGFVASIARPGGNITGLVSFEPAMGGKWLETLKEIAPDVHRFRFTDAGRQGNPPPIRQRRGDRTCAW